MWPNYDLLHYQSIWDWVKPQTEKRESFVCWYSKSMTSSSAFSRYSPISFLYTPTSLYHSSFKIMTPNSSLDNDVLDYMPLHNENTFFPLFFWHLHGKEDFLILCSLLLRLSFLPCLSRNSSHSPLFLVAATAGSHLRDSCSFKRLRLWHYFRPSLILEIGISIPVRHPSTCSNLFHCILYIKCVEYWEKLYRINLSCV